MDLKDGFVLPGGSSVRLQAYFILNLYRIDLDGRTWEGLCRMLSVMRLHLSGGVVLSGTIVRDGCKMKFPINSRDMLMRAEVCDAGRDGVVHDVSGRNTNSFFLCHREFVSEILEVFMDQ